MKKLATIICLFLCSFTYANIEFSINGAFNNPIKGLPENWYSNNKKGEIKVVRQDSRNIVELTSKLKPIHLFSRYKEFVVVGDRVKISAKIKGNGKAILGVYLFEYKSDKWLGSNLHMFDAEPDWKEGQFDFELKNVNNKKPGRIRIVFGIEKNASISFANLQAEKKTVISSTKTNSLELTLPKTFYGVPGIETGIYLDNIILTQTPNLYTLDVKPKIGKIEENRWVIIPTEQQQGKHPFDISIITKDQKVRAQGNIVLNIAPKTAGEGKNLTMLIIGDSLTEATHYSNEIARLLSKKGNPKWKMIGTRKKANGVSHEGYGGWTWWKFIKRYVKNKPENKHYTSGSSPFVFLDQQGKPKLDIERYFREKCNGVKPDVITVLLGINDCFGLARCANDLAAVNHGIDNILKNAEILIKELRQAAPNAIIGICLTTPPNVRQKAFFANYKGKINRWSWKQVQHTFVQRQIKHFSNREKDNVYIIPTELNLDCVKGYADNNGVHPNKKGYQQIGASIYCWLKWQLYKNIFK